MGRKAFLFDLGAEATTDIQSIDHVGLTDSGEEFVFQFDNGSGNIVTVTALPTDMATYPEGNMYFMSSDKKEYDPTLEKLQRSLTGLTIRDVLLKTADALQLCSQKLCGLASIPASDDGHESGDNDEFDDNGNDDEEEPEDFSFFVGMNNAGSSDNRVSDVERDINAELARCIDNKISSDLTRVKTAGYRVGILRGMKAASTKSILSISYRISRLGLSQEVLEAWNLEPQRYFVLLIQYSDGYQGFDTLKTSPVQSISMDFRVGTCARYKPTLASAEAAFASVRKQDLYATSHSNGDTLTHENQTGSTTTQPPEQAPEEANFNMCFISSPMRQLLSTSFLSLLKIRDIHNCTWESAKAFLQDNANHTDPQSGPAFNHLMEDAIEKTLPNVVLDDELLGRRPRDVLPSLPLIAMQFTLLYTVRCTEFCLVCHKPVTQQFEALKPYVCDSPLCLYQYMTLGFGPSLEHEILSQPYVTDLLVSFCYTAAFSRRLREYPIGMGLTVPAIYHYPESQFFAKPGSDSVVVLAGTQSINQHKGTATAATPTINKPLDSKVDTLDLGLFGYHAINIDFHKNQFCLPAEGDGLPKFIAPGNWMVITAHANDTTKHNVFHCRVVAYSFPVVTFVLNDEQKVQASAICASSEKQHNAVQSHESKHWYIEVSGIVAFYDRNFDELPDSAKAQTICEILCTLPPIDELVAYLSRSTSTQTSLSAWSDRISPAALGLLRWIVASNRSSIVQLDHLDSMGPGIGKSRLDQRLANMGDYIQFRFAQGAPSKEALFQKALKSMAKNEEPVQYVFDRTTQDRRNRLYQQIKRQRNTMARGPLPSSQPAPFGVPRPAGAPFTMPQLPVTTTAPGSLQVPPLPAPLGFLPLPGGSRPVTGAPPAMPPLPAMAAGTGSLQVPAAGPHNPSTQMPFQAFMAAARQSHQLPPVSTHVNPPGGSSVNIGGLSTAPQTSVPAVSVPPAAQMSNILTNPTNPHASVGQQLWARHNHHLQRIPVQSVAQALKAPPTPANLFGKEYPSLFAWHGSALANWHSIIRQGLDFKEILNARAYGHGVYHSFDFETSLGYSLNTIPRGSHINFIIPSTRLMNTPSWPNSALGVTGALCLNEIVNAPERFTSTHPHLVVQYPEWIMCRYLVVRCDPLWSYNRKNIKEAALNPGGHPTPLLAQPVLPSRSFNTEQPCGPFIQQQHERRPRRRALYEDGTIYVGRHGGRADGTGYVGIEIPMAAFPASRKFVANQELGVAPSASDNAATSGNDQRRPQSKKKGAKRQRTASPLTKSEAGDESEESDLEDLSFFRSEAAINAIKQADDAKMKAIDFAELSRLTSFRPGSLDRSTIQQLAPPAYATSTCTRRLQKELKTLANLQESEPLHELGWYIDTESITNLYQWIIELHSFPLSLPLGTDMVNAGVQSVVLEVRFGPDFPMQPPFVRVVRPRFLPFMHGGGGHVTGGGAICMELLTNSGWNPTCTIESILIQIRLAISSTDPRPARIWGSVAAGFDSQQRAAAMVGLQRNANSAITRDYGIGEAVEAYERAARAHGWAVPNMRGVGGDPES